MKNPVRQLVARVLQDHPAVLYVRDISWRAAMLFHSSHDAERREYRYIPAKRRIEAGFFYLVAPLRNGQVVIVWSRSAARSEPIMLTWAPVQDLENWSHLWSDTITYTFHHLGFVMDRVIAQRIEQRVDWVAQRDPPRGLDVSEEAVVEEEPEEGRLEYLGQCDRLRMGDKRNEQYWQTMMEEKKPISLARLKALVDIAPILDEGETIEDFVRSDPNAKAYESVWGGKKAVFLQVAGFEFIWGEQPPWPRSSFRF